MLSISVMASAIRPCLDAPSSRPQQPQGSPHHFPASSPAVQPQRPHLTHLPRLPRLTRLWSRKSRRCSWWASADCGFPPTVTAQSLGALNDPAETKRQADSIAQTLAACGFNMNFAPVLDLNVNPESPAIGAIERSFSADPAVVAEQARIFMESHDAQGVASCFKHFPGHGSATADSHLGLVDVTETWSEQELTPYANLVGDGNTRAVMTAHVFNRAIDAELPATLSPAFINGILRQQLGFDGVVVTDDLQMTGLAQFFDYQTIIERSILAGVDIILVSNNLAYDPEITPTTIKHVVDLVRSGRITEERINESYQRITALKYRLASRQATAN